MVVRSIQSIPVVYPLVLLYLVMIVAANLTVATFGSAAILANSSLLIAGDLVLRDRLHDAWDGRGLPGRMVLLIATGSVLSAALNAQAWPVAVASFGAFAAAGVVDTVVYGRLHGHAWMWRSNGSNVASSLVDSITFLSLLAALGGLPWLAVPVLVAGQWAAKVTGGLVWSFFLRARAGARR